MVQEILSLVIDSKSCRGAVVSTDGELLGAAEKPFQMDNYALFGAVQIQVLQQAFDEVLRQLAQTSKSPIALAISTPLQTSVLIGSENRVLTPALFGEGVLLPRSEVPSEFAEDARAASVYRLSVVRQIQLRRPELGLGIRRVATLGAFLIHGLSGAWVDNRSCRPVGMPYNLATEEYAREPHLWLAAGIERPSLPLGVSAGGIAAQLTTRRAQALGLPSGLPIVASAHRFACEAYGLNANAGGWTIRLGEELETGWVGPRRDTLKEVQIQVLDAGTEADETPMELGIDDASAELWRRVGEDGGAQAEAPMTDRHLYFFPRAQGLLETKALLGELDGDIEPESFRGVPVGCDGLRFLPGVTSGVLLGMKPGHEPKAFQRAVFEGALLEVRRMRTLGGIHGLQPPRLLLAPPWSLELAHLAVDILGEPCVVWDSSPRLPALLGQALAVARGLGHKPQPTFSLPLVQPGARASSYERAFGLHQLLCAELRQVLG